jgi:hypothetical protein
VSGWDLDAGHGELVKVRLRLGRKLRLANTAFTFKGETVDAEEIGKELGVASVLPSP